MKLVSIASDKVFSRQAAVDGLEYIYGWQDSAGKWHIHLDRKINAKHGTKEVALSEAVRSWRLGLTSDRRSATVPVQSNL